VDSAWLPGVKYDWRGDEVRTPRYHVGVAPHKYPGKEFS